MTPEEKAERRCACGRELDRGGRTIKCSLCVTVNSSAQWKMDPPTRTCQWCKETFSGRKRVYCTPFCRNTANTAAKLERAGSLVVQEKRCNKCGEVRPAYMFNIDVTKVDGLNSTGCRVCLSSKHKEWREKPENRDRIRNGNLMRAYGMSIADYEKLLAAQDGRCAICKRKAETFKRRLSVDHDHQSGAIRSLACDHCNKFKISNLTLEDVDKLYEYFHSPPADKAFGERRFVPKGMESGRKKRKQPRKRQRGKNNG